MPGQSGTFKTPPDDLIDTNDRAQHMADGGEVTPPDDLLAPPDDLTDASGPPPDLLSPPDDLTDTAEPPTKTSTLVHAAERGVAPALTGMAGMGLGAEIAAPLAPLAGPLAPVVPIIGALAGGFGAAYLTSEAQDKLLSMLPDSVREYIGQSAAQRAAEGDAHPVVSVAGEMLPQLLTMRPGSTLPLREGANAIERLFAGPVSSRVIGAGLGAGQEAAQEASSDEPMSPARIAASAGVGAALNRPTALGERLEQAGARLVPGARPTPDAAPPPPDAPPPDADAPPPEGAPAPGAVVGLRQKDGAPERVVIESVQDGYVFYRDQDNRQRADALDEFQRDLTDAPPARNPDQGDATTVPEAPPDATPPPDLLDEMYAEQAEQAPAAPPRAQPPSPQADLPLPETRVVDDLLGQAAAQREAAARVRATKPDDAAFFERSAASLEARAKDLSDRIGAPADTVRDVDLRPVDEDAVKLGALGEHAREPGEPVPEPVAPPPAGQDTGLGPLGRFARPENGEPPVPERPAAPEPVDTAVDAPVDRTYEIAQRRSEAARKARMTRIGSRPLDLAEFVAKNGGIRLDDPNIGDVRQAIGAPQKMVRDFGPLIRRAGKPLDELREMAEEAGYFGNREGTTVPDLVDALDRNLKGERQFAARDQGEVADRAGAAEAQRAADEFENTYGADGEGETRFAAQRMKDAGLLDDTLDPMADHPDDLRAAIDERLAMMGADDIDSAMSVVDAQLSPVVGHQSAKGTFGDDIRIGKSEGAAGEGYAPPERVPARGAKPEPDVEPTKGGSGLGQSPDQIQSAAGAYHQSWALSEDPFTLRSGVDPADIIRLGHGMFGAIGRVLKSRGGEKEFPPTAARAAEPQAGWDRSNNELRRLGAFGRFGSFAVGLAARHPAGARYLVEQLGKMRRRDALEREGGRDLGPYYDLKDASRRKVDAALEHDTINDIQRRDQGRRVVVRVAPGQKLQLSKPGDVIALSPEETAAFFSLRKFFDRRLMDIGAAMAAREGYAGAFTQGAIRAAEINAADQGAKTAARRAGEIFEAVQEGRRRGYAPLRRYGDWAIRITPKIGMEPGKDAMPARPEWVEFVDTRGPFSGLLSESAPVGSVPKKVAARVADLEREFPRDKYDYRQEPVKPRTIESLDIPAIEKLFMVLSQKDPELGAALYDRVLAEVYNERLAGFRKQRQNIPGYSVDFERAIADYGRQSADVVANIEHGEAIQRAYEATQQHPDRNVRDYWRAHREHFESRSADLARVRQFGFYANLWGSPAAAVVNLSQTPLVTTFQLGSWAGQARAQTLVYPALAEAFSAVQRGPRGLEIDFNKLGKTPAERAMIKSLHADGTLDAVISQDLQGADVPRYHSLRPAAKFLSRVYDVGASAFNIAEQINRVTAALAYYRAAATPEARAQFAKVYGKDEYARALTESRSMSPEAIARFGVDETQFLGGKINRQPIQRGVGSVLLQFKTYPANYMRLLYKNMTSMGPEGKMAGTMMLLGLVGASGLMGLPFADDVVAASEWGYRLATGIDPMLERRLRSLLLDSGFDRYGAEAIVRGPSRLLGVDLSQRLGLGQIAPSSEPIDMAGPVVSAVLGKPLEALRRLYSGQPVGAAVAGASPLIGKGPADVLRGLVQIPEEGYSTQRGQPVVMPSKITAGEQAARAVGFQPTEFARASEYARDQKRIADSTRGASSNQLTAIARNLALAEDARRSGNQTAAQQFDSRAAALFTANARQLADMGIPDWRKVPAPSRGAVRNRVRQMLAPLEAAARNAPKMKRAEMSRSPFLRGD